MAARRCAVIGPLANQEWVTQARTAARTAFPSCSLLLVHEAEFRLEDAGRLEGAVVSGTRQDIVATLATAEVQTETVAVPEPPPEPEVQEEPQSVAQPTTKGAAVVTSEPEPEPMDEV